MAAAGSILGNAVQRLEDPTLLTGAGKYLDDLAPAGTLHVAFVRSNQAYANVVSVDVSDAESMPGVKAVYHARGDDLGIPTLQGFEMLPPTLNRPIFANDVVRFVGDIVAAVVATSKAEAVDAADTIVVDYERLQPVVTAAQGLTADAAILFPEHGSNVCFGTDHGADVDPFEGADAIAEVTMVSQRLAGAPMETNGILAEPGDSPGTMTCWISHQAPHAAHGAIAGMLGMKPTDLRVVCPWVGGGFGPKSAVYPEYMVAAAACRALGAPVKWAETRSEDMVALVHGRDYVMTAKLGVTKDGKFTGLEGDVTSNAGSYPGIGAILPMLTQMMSVGVYDLDKVKFATRAVLTNTTPIGAYRGAGRPEATQLLERVIDVAAQKIGMDPAEIRRRNFIQPDAFPLTTNTGAAYDSGEYEKALDAALAASGYKELRAEQARRRAANDPIALGIGVSSYVEVTAPVGLHVEFGADRDPRRRHGQCVCWNKRARPGTSHSVRHAGIRRPRHPDGPDQARQLRHRSDSARVGNVGLAIAADCRLGHLRGLQRGVESSTANRCPPARGCSGGHGRRSGFASRRGHSDEVDFVGRARCRIPRCFQAAGGAWSRDPSA